MCTRIPLWMLALALALFAAGCGGGGSNGPLTLTSIGPNVPVSLQTTLQITGKKLNDHADLRLHVVGVGSFPCTPTSGTTATCTLAPFALPVGSHDVYLFTPERYTETYPNALTVDAQPTLASCVPDTFDARFNKPFTITGTGFVEPLTVQFLDASDQPVGPQVSGTVGGGGSTVAVESPILPGFAGGPMLGNVRVMSGDGQSGSSMMPITVDCIECDAREIDGTGNNASNDLWGSAGIQLLRGAASDYADGLSSPAGASRPSARAVSNAVCSQTSSPANSVAATNFFWLWGQFLDHDIDLTGAADPVEPFDIPVPTGDVAFDPFNTGTQVITLDRSVYDSSTGTSSPREQLNLITSWLDGSVVYGSDATRQAALRMNDGSGALAMGAGALLPFNTFGLGNASLPGQDPTSMFLSGDVRVNEQVGLTAVHTLFSREHNRIAAEIRTKNPHLTGDEVYEAARMRVVALIQKISFKDFMPLMLGSGVIPAYPGYDVGVQPDIANVFSTACYRFGHSLVAPTVARLDATLAPIPDGNLALRDAFFSPSRITDEGGIDPILRGFATTEAEELDTLIVDDLRNFLFGPPGAGGFDLASLNIQRGRDHGLADYNAVRVAYGLSAVTTFAQITSDTTLQTTLQALYGTVDDVDAWVGGLAEDKLSGALVGELLSAVFADQFTRLRDGDRFWYERALPADVLAEVEATTLADVIRRNTAIGAEIPDNVFVLAVP